MKLGASFTAQIFAEGTNRICFAEGTDAPCLSRKDLKELMDESGLNKYCAYKRIRDFFHHTDATHEWMVQAIK